MWNKNTWSLAIIFLLLPISFCSCKVDTSTCVNKGYDLEVLSYSNSYIKIKVLSNLSGRKCFYLIPAMDSDWQYSKDPYFPSTIYPCYNIGLGCYNESVITLNLPSYIYPWYYRIYSYIENGFPPYPCSYDKEVKLDKESKVIEKSESKEIKVTVNFPNYLIQGKTYEINYTVSSNFDANCSSYLYLYNETFLASYGCNEECSYSWTGNRVYFTLSNSNISLSSKIKILDSINEGIYKIKLRVICNNKRYDTWKEILVIKDKINVNLSCNRTIKVCNFWKDSNFSLILDGKRIDFFLKKYYCKYFNGNFAVLLYNNLTLSYCYNNENSNNKCNKKLNFSCPVKVVKEYVNICNKSHIKNVTSFSFFDVSSSYQYIIALIISLFALYLAFRKL